MPDADAHPPDEGDAPVTEPAVRRSIRARVGLAAAAIVAAAGGVLAGQTYTAPDGEPTTPNAFDPDRPIELGGTEGVTPEQEAAAEELLRRTREELPRFAEVADAEAAGYRSVGDGGAGVEHFTNWSYVEDRRSLDPEHPESLVYIVGAGGERTLAAAMYVLPPGSTFDDVPADLHSPLIQWHVHQDLCFADGPAGRRLASVVEVGHRCPEGQQLERAPMIHVWIVPNECGPFASLDGIGAGQTPSGEHRCDRSLGEPGPRHGHH
jgi:hypothetical protein